MYMLGCPLLRGAALHKWEKIESVHARRFDNCLFLRCTINYNPILGALLGREVEDRVQTPHRVIGVSGGNLIFCFLVSFCVTLWTLHSNPNL